MKKQILTIILILLISFTFACSKDSDWAVKIDDQTISMKDFNRFYYSQNKIMLNLATNEEVDKLAEDAESLSNPQLRQLLVKQNFLDQLIAQRLIYNKAYSDKSIDKKEMEAVVEFTKMQALASYYIAQKLRDRLQITDDEVEEFYRTHRQHFRGIPLNQEVIDRIKQQILMEKSQFETNQYLRNLLEEAKVDRKGLTNALQAEAEARELREDLERIEREEAIKADLEKK